MANNNVKCIKCGKGELKLATCNIKNSSALSQTADNTDTVILVNEALTYASTTETVPAKTVSQQ